VLGVHLTNTFLLLGALALTVQFAATPSRTPARWQWGRIASAAIATVLGCLVVGVSGAIAALGDTLFPVDSLAEALRQDLSATSHVLIRLRLVHPWVAVLVGAGICGFALAMRSRFAAVLGHLPMLLVWAVGGQLAIGLLNVVLLAPVSIQLLHLAFADVLWIVLVRLVAAGLDAEALGA
jgi:cytochrome c oxidase assembly protein subunit 15